MINKIKKTIGTYQMIENGNPIIVGVSGGPDSMALLDVLQKTVSNPLVVAHLNHQFRGQDAKDDADFVKKEADKRGIESVIESYNVPKFMEETGLGGQEAARKLRYEFYRQTAQKYSASYIALGHHASDQAETVLMRILRGTGTHGLSGIPYTRSFEKYKIIRPLLDVSREEIENYCNENNIKFRTDQSNFSTKYFRNEIRLKVLPYLEEFNPKLENNLHHMAKVLQDEDRFLSDMAQAYIDNNFKINKENFKLPIISLQKLDIALQRRVIHLILTYLNLTGEYTFHHIEKILYLIDQQHPSKSLDLPGLMVKRNYGELVFLTTLINNTKQPYTYDMNVSEVVLIPGLNKRIRSFVTENYEQQTGIWAVFDYKLLKDEHLKIRSRRNGDRIEPLGLNGSKKVKDLFIDYKIPKDEREMQPILECGNKILWIPGIKRSKHAIITPNTKEFLYVIMD